MSTLVVGGTSGLGLELAKELATEDGVIVTGRHDPEVDGIEYRPFDLRGSYLPRRIGDFVLNLPEINSLVYAAGYYQEGRITDLDQQEIDHMIDVGGRGLIYFMKSLLEKQGKLNELITITSTSQWTPRKLEPVYNFVKAGAGHFANAIAEDGRVDKVLVAAPSGMRTNFWQNGHPDWDKFLEPKAVCNEIIKARKGKYHYKYIRILRDPLRVEEVEKR